MTDAALHPPRPRLVLRVGVTGHRPGASLPEDAVARVREQVRAVLECAARTADSVWQRFRGDVFSDQQPPLLVAVSALAEGGDRIVAEEVVSAAWELQAVLPRRRDDYEQDFATEDSRKQFRALLEGRTVFEIDNPNADQEQSTSYETAGLVMLDHADLLIAIWDGGESRGRGGTREIMGNAIRRAIPVVWIDTLNAAPPALWNRETRTPLTDLQGSGGGGTTLSDVISMTLSPPSGAGNGINALRPLRDFLEETQRRPRFWSGAYQILLGVVSGKRPIRLVPHLSSVAERADEWRDFIGTLPPAGRLTEALDRVLLVRYLWADRVATELGHIYRSAYVLNFLFSALAVASGLFAIFYWNRAPHGEELNPLANWLTHPLGDALTAKTTFAVVELLLILLIVLITWRGSESKWHQRFLDSRLLAEMLRHARVLAPLALQTPIDKTAADPGTLWTAWYAQATLRELPLPNARADAGYLRAVAAATIREEVDGQIDYHENNALHLHDMHERLDLIGYRLFKLTLLLCIVWLALAAFVGYDLIDHHGKTAWIKPALTYFGAVLPAFAAALAGIRAQGDFRAFSKSSLATEKKLRQLKAQLENPKETANYDAMCLLLRSVADTMASDVGTWRLVYRNHPLTLPG